jgi:hypothetical protein
MKNPADYNGKIRRTGAGIVINHAQSETPSVAMKSAVNDNINR